MWAKDPSGVESSINFSINFDYSCDLAYITIDLIPIAERKNEQVKGQLYKTEEWALSHAFVDEDKFRCVRAIEDVKLVFDSGLEQQAQKQCTEDGLQ